MLLIEHADINWPIKVYGEDFLFCLYLILLSLVISLIGMVH